MKTVFNTALAAISIFAIACGGEDLTTLESWAGPEALDTVPQEPSSNSGEALADELEGISVSDEALADELEGKLNSYALAVLDRDVDMLKGLMSTEVLGQIDAKGMDMGAFADKMSSSLLRTFDTMTSTSDLGWFSVESMRIEGNAARVEVSRQGETLGKPFYFVDEQGEYKLNLVSPGFSRPLAEGAAGSWNTYIVANLSPETAPAYCTTGSGANIDPNGQVNLSCVDKCGAVFSGGRFFANLGQYNQRHRYCDYNTWGVDAYYYLDGTAEWDLEWYVACNDNC
jgi:hypothetical protein